MFLRYLLTFLSIEYFKVFSWDVDSKKNNKSFNILKTLKEIFLK